MDSPEFPGRDDPNAIANSLNRRGIPTALQRRWGSAQILRLLDSHHIAGIRVFRGAEIGPGIWPAIIDVAMFREVQERRAYRSVVNREKYAAQRFYLLRGLVWCTRCGRRMAGKGSCNLPVYVCNSPRATHGEVKCFRRVGAPTLESFVKDAAISLLERLDLSSQEASALLSEDDHAAIDADRAEIAELKDMWDCQEITTAQYRQMRKVIETRIKKIEAKTIIRPAAEVLAVGALTRQVDSPRLMARVLRLQDDLTPYRHVGMVEEFIEKIDGLAAHGRE